MITPVSSWSISKAHDFERCKKFFWLRHIERVPEPERPLPPGKTEHANDRGTRVHQNCEDYVLGKIDELCPEAEKHFGPQIDLLRVMYADGIVSLEGEWGYSRDWEPWGWSGQWVEVESPAEAIAEWGMPVKKVKALPEGRAIESGSLYQVGKKLYFWESSWLRMKLDAMVFLSETEAIVIDYKTGRKYGNEGKHGEQMQLYQIGAFCRYPKLQEVTAELWYLDQNEVTSKTYKRDQGLRFRRNFELRGDKITTCLEYPAAANVFACKWCQYGPWNGGQCQEGVQGGFGNTPSKKGKR